MSVDSPSIHDPEDAVRILERLDGNVNGLFEQVSVLRDRVGGLETENESLREQNAALQRRVDILEDDAGASGKAAKVRDIVHHAENLRCDDQLGVALAARDIKGATGCTRRYAYDLIDDLPDEYPFLLSREEARQRQYGHAELDGEKQTKALVVDFELLHSDPGAVNKFTTRTSQEGGRD